MRLLDAVRRAVARVHPPGWLRAASNLLGHRRRRVWASGERVHVELRDLDEAEFRRFAAAVDATFAALGGIDAVRLNGVVGRAVIVRDPARWGPEALADILSAIELRLGLHERPFCTAIPDYPADREPLLRKAVDLGADGVGVALGTMLRVVGYSPTRRASTSRR